MDDKSEYKLFIGNYENVIGKVVYYRCRNRYIPCRVTMPNFIILSTS